MTDNLIAFVFLGVIALGLLIVIGPLRAAATGRPWTRWYTMIAAAIVALWFLLEGNELFAGGFRVDEAYRVRYLANLALALGAALFPFLALWIGFGRRRAAGATHPGPEPDTHPEGLLAALALALVPVTALAYVTVCGEGRWFGNRNACRDTVEIWPVLGLAWLAGAVLLVVADRHWRRNHPHADRAGADQIDA